MTKLFFLLSFFFSFTILTAFGQYGQNVEYLSYNEQVTVSSSNIFFSKVNVHGKTLSKLSQIDFIYSELEEVSNIKLQIFSNNSSIYFDGKGFNEESVFSHIFYTGLKRKYFTVQNECEFFLSYELRHVDFNFICTPSIMQFTVFDTTRVSFILPVNQYYLSYKAINVDDSLLSISKNRVNNDSIYRFRIVSNNEVISNNLSSQVIRKPLNNVRTTILPIAYKDKNEEYFCAWYLNLVDHNLKLSDSTITDLNRIILGSDDSLKVIETIFNYVRDKITYIDIENGFDALRLRDVNKVFYNKFGDCKDMAGLLYAILTYKGFNAKLCLASTLSHIYDIDFISNQSANHLICYLTLNNKEYFLDATDKTASYNDIPTAVNGKTVFVINKNGGFYKKIPILDMEKQLFANTYELTYTEDSIFGKYRLELKGVLAKQLYYTIDANKPNYLSEINKFWEQITLRINASSFKLKYCSDSLMLIESDISIKSTYIQSIDTHKFLAMNCFPFPHNLPLNLNFFSDIVNYVPINFETKIQIKTLNNILLSKTREKIKFKEMDFDYTYDVENIANAISINYSLKYPNSLIKSININTYNQLNRKILNNFNNVVQIY